MYGKTRIPPAAHVMRYRGKYLEDSVSLNELNIVKDSTIYMTARLCGGNKEKGFSSTSKSSYKTYLPLHYSFLTLRLSHLCSKKYNEQVKTGDLIP